MILPSSHGRPLPHRRSTRHRWCRVADLSLGLLAATMLGLSAPQAGAVRSGPDRPTPPSLVVIHSTGGPFCDPSGRAIWVPGGELMDDIRTIEAHPRLGVHYMIGRDGTLLTSVPEHQIAHHVLAHSARAIGIELVNDGDGVEPFPPAQIDALVGLLRDIVRRNGIRADGVKRHSDLDHSRLKCAPNRRRKVDPGPAFPFEQVLDRVYPR